MEASDIVEKLRKLPLLGALQEVGLEPDQRLVDAAMLSLEYANPDLPGSIQTLPLFTGLLRLNTRGMEWISLERLRLPLRHRSSISVHEALASESVVKLVGSAISSARIPRTLGTSHLLAAIIENAIEARGYLERTRAADQLFLAFGANPWNIWGVPSEMRSFLGALKKTIDTSQDYQYMLALEGENIKFRVVSTLGDYLEGAPDGFAPHRALLTHCGSIGIFAAETILELEEFVNNPVVREADLQKFFEQHPYFFRQWDYREVYPHVFLTRTRERELIPDFIITNRDSQRAAIVELKLPRHAVVVRDTDNRSRFSSAVMKARSQLLEYRRWFDSSENRTRLQAKIGMKVYMPRLMVIIGRSSEFVDDFDRQKLSAENPDLEVVTFDDIVKAASRRRAFIEGAT